MDLYFSKISQKNKGGKMNLIDIDNITNNSEGYQLNGESFKVLYDHYIKKADDAVVAKDRLLAEQHYQHADHYLRLMNNPLKNFSLNPPCHYLTAHDASEKSSQDGCRHYAEHPPFRGCGA
jgi:hypothetical protein